MIQEKRTKNIIQKEIYKHVEPFGEKTSMSCTIVEKNDKMKVILPNPFQTKLEQRYARNRIEKKSPKTNMIPNEIYIKIDPIWERTSKNPEEKMRCDGEKKLNTTLKSWCETRRLTTQPNHDVQVYTVRGGSGGEVAENSPGNVLQGPGNLFQVREIGETWLQQRTYKNAAKTRDRDPFTKCKQQQFPSDALSQVQSKQQTKAEIKGTRKNIKNLSQEIK